MDWWGRRMKLVCFPSLLHLITIWKPTLTKPGTARSWGYSNDPTSRALLSGSSQLSGDTSNKHNMQSGQGAWWRKTEWGGGSSDLGGWGVSGRKECGLLHPHRAPSRLLRLILPLTHLRASEHILGLLLLPIPALFLGVLGPFHSFNHFVFADVS